MPIYEYHCDACDHEFDALQKLSAAPLTDCPACAAPALRKKLSAAAFRLKGSGWYETDFKQSGRKNLVDGGEKPAATAPADSGSGADSKPATKTETVAATKPAANDSGKTQASAKPAPERKAA